MLQFFEWFWKAIGLTERLEMQAERSFQGFIYYRHIICLQDGKGNAAAAIFLAGILLCIVIPYLLGSLNAAIIISTGKYHDDIRNHGSGNAGMTNMTRVFGKKAMLMTLAGDVAKQFVSVLVGILLMGELGAYVAGLFCMLGHIFPIYYHFKGGKGVLTAAAMVLCIDYQVFLIAMAIFMGTVLITRYISLGSIIAGFSLPGIVYASAALRGIYPSIPALGFAMFIGLTIIIMHRSNIRRLMAGKESRFSFKKKPEVDVSGKSGQ